MQEWFNQQTAGMVGGIIGTIIGIFGAAIGCLSGFCVQKGYKKLFYRICGAMIFICAVLFLIGLTALILKQPYHVWYAFLLPGFIGTLITSCVLPVIGKRFTEFEIRQMQAKDL